MSRLKSPSANVAMALTRGVKFGASGSNVRVFSASPNVAPRLMKSWMVSVWSPLVTITRLSSVRTGE